MTSAIMATGVTVRPLRSADQETVVRIDARHTGRRKPAWWADVFKRSLSSRRGRVRVGLAAEVDGSLVGYLLGEARAFEFGSEPCGWIFAVGVAPDRAREGIASRLVEAACARFAEAGMSRVRTMVRREDVPVLSFFRANGFVGGAFVQLERELDHGERP